MGALERSIGGNGGGAGTATLLPSTAPSLLGRPPSSPRPPYPGCHFPPAPAAAAMALAVCSSVVAATPSLTEDAPGGSNCRQRKTLKWWRRAIFAEEAGDRSG